MIRRAAFALAAIVLAGCNTPKDAFEPLPGRAVGASETYRSPKDHFSVALPAGWKLTEEYGSLVLAADGDPRKRDSILVRAARIEGGGDSAEKRTPEVVLPATKRTILGLPGATLETERPVQYAGLAGHEYTFSFMPKGKPGQRYERRHVVLFGTGGNLFHVVHTGRPGALRRTRGEFESVLSSLKEEV